MTLHALILLLSVQATDPSAADILKSVDEKAAAFQDLTLEASLSISEVGGATRQVTFTFQEKAVKRLIRFTGPEDIKGMGFLFDGADAIYALLPAFGNRVRRLGANSLNLSFMGSDFSPRDLSGARLADSLEAKLVSGDASTWLLSCTPKAGKELGSSSRTVTVDRQNRRILRIEDFGEDGKKTRTLTFENFIKPEGDADMSVAGLVTAVDHVRSDHKSVLRIVAAKSNQGLGDELFKKEALAPK